MTVGITEEQRAAIGDPPTGHGILGLLIAMHTAEAEYSQLAAERASDSRVREFARMMIREHGAMKEDVNELSRQLGVTTRAPERAEDVQEELRDDAEDLRALSGREFDEEFLNEQMDMHQRTLDTLEELDDRTTTPELRQSLERAKTTERQHLERARQLAESFDA